ncbi:MAG: hypothetical protein K5872_20900 [Rhizobiaceae bacterium]|nr:hypothetical protein [Rhizobiaceae bacterium]MCV0408676.1 hypothetical protein [Rhizobiaceae bacterium]
MPRRKAAYRRRVPRQKDDEAVRIVRRPAPRLVCRPELVVVGGSEVIRVVGRPGSGMFSDGMPVAEFLRRLPTRERAMRMIASAVSRGTIELVSADEFVAGELAP